MQEIKKNEITLHTWFCSVLFSLNYFILFMSVYINATLRPGHQGPCLGPALTLLWLCPFLWGEESQGSRGEEPRAHIPPLWVTGTPELPAPTAQDRFLPWICLSDGGPHHCLLGVWTELGDTYRWGVHTCEIPLTPRGNYRWDEKMMGPGPEPSFVFSTQDPHCSGWPW